VLKCSEIMRYIRELEVTVLVPWLTIFMSAGTP
jgi:hypothetical protein